ncbi:MAG: transcription elongation factor GreA [Treponema sp.]|nr:transcription elongation factor GreA [Treponema sp.]MDY3721167.1 transcription elongation factor GreA [Treponema sp.]MDY5757502.1 transcription elongation factor GreA [Treponema sp.]MDY5817999.1 transcription elongation factor GreA [Treponema sp.]
MAELMQSIQDMLKEETWTRATISNYTQANLKELADLVEKAKAEGIKNEVYDLCQEHLSHSKDSIIALYICGILDLQNGSLDNSNLVTLVDIFQKNHKENIVTYLCESILEDDENNKFALRTLADSYLAEGNDKVWEFYEKIVRIDFDEAELAKLLAEHYETAGDVENTVSYYKKAIIRFIKANNYNACKEIWTKLVQLIPEEIDFFQNLRRKISKQMGDIKTTNLMQELYNYYKDNKKWDTAILILKQNLEIDPKDTWARKEITDCFRGKYASHSHLDDYIRSSNLTQSYRNVFEAINDFEKHIAFDKGGFVFHRNWGVGIIKNLDNDTLTINFGNAGGIREIKLAMAVTALKPLTKDHIWVLKALNYVKEDGKKVPLAEKIKKDKEWALKTIIKSFDNNCDFKRIKAELVPSILTPGEWTSWNTTAKKILESNPIFDVNPNDITMYTVHDGNITPVEKLANEFKAQKAFFARADILMKFFDNPDMDRSSESFAEMYSYFTGYLKNISKVSEQVLASYLLVRRISAEDSQFAFPIKETFADIYKRLENPREIFTELKDSKHTHFKEDFLECIKMLPDWNEQYIRLFPTVLDMKLINQLIKNGFTADVQKLAKTSFEIYKDYRETVLFFFEKCQDFDWFKAADIPYEKQLITLINIIELTFREINNHVNTTENKKINKKATDLLFENDTIFTYMFSKDETTVKKMYTLIDDISNIDADKKSTARNKILEKYPDFKFRVSEEKTSQPKGMIVTAKKLAEKKAEIDNIKNVELEKNKVELADAKAKGDLKENAEYQAAKEAKHQLEMRLSKLQEELSRAVIFDPTTSTTAVISFATVVTLHDNIENKDEEYTILGPWESDPDNNIISYMSPFGDAILDKKVGDTVKFTINEHNYDYTVKAINKAKNF